MVPPKPKSPTKFVPITPLDSTTQEQLDAEPVDAHYNRLYSCKHFRNRVLRIQQLCAENSIDAVLILTGIDSRNDSEMRKLLNWLVWGYSCSDIYGESHSYLFDDSFFIVGKDSL